ncbi:fibronectin type III domain-containing protein, partial [Streptomyces sp. NPDC056944]|uniref:fibronectin type III domain-containing protein n=1 Tax=Streptomyces sp. NPDC056944 TaxID=3345972 RepID=UPI00362D6054
AYYRRSRDATAVAEAPPEPEDPYEGSFGTNGGGGGVAGYPEGDDERSSDTQTTGPRTNAAWSDLVSDKLADSYTGPQINGALGRYLSKQPLSPLDVDIIRAAIARAGYPPEGSYPVIPGGTALLLVAPGGLSGTSGQTSVALKWNAVSGASGYAVYRDGTRVATSTTASATVDGLPHATAYNWQVSAVASNGSEGPKSSTVRVGTAPKWAAKAPVPSKPIPKPVQPAAKAATKK